MKSTIAGCKTNSSAATEPQPKRSFGRNLQIGMSSRLVSASPPAEGQPSPMMASRIFSLKKNQPREYQLFRDYPLNTEADLTAILDSCFSCVNVMPAVGISGHCPYDFTDVVRVVTSRVEQVPTRVHRKTASRSSTKCPFPLQHGPDEVNCRGELILVPVTPPSVLTP